MCPSYDYDCECGHKFEAFVPISERNKQVCPKCGKTPKALIGNGGAGFIMKGDGFFQNDYPKDKRYDY